MLQTCRDVPGAWGDLEELAALGAGHSHTSEWWDLGGAPGSLGSPISCVLQTWVSGCTPQEGCPGGSG